VKVKGRTTLIEFVCNSRVWREPHGGKVTTKAHVAGLVKVMEDFGIGIRHAEMRLSSSKRLSILL